MDKLLRGCCVILLASLCGGCMGSEEEEEINYDRMVKNNDESEWVSSPDPDGQHIAGDLFPDPQEIIMQEMPDPSQAIN